MREFYLLSGTDPGLCFPKLKASLYDDYWSAFPPESNVIEDAPLTNLDEVFNLP